MRLSWKVRGVRAGVFALVCVLCTGAGHGMASDRAVPWSVLLAGWLAVFGAAMAGGRREWSGGPMTAAVLASQLGLHLGFGLATSGCAPGMTHMGTAGVPGMADTGTTGVSPSMLGMHLLAALVVAWWLRCGEAAAWRVARRSAARALRAARRCLGLPRVPAEDRRLAWVSMPSGSGRPVTERIVVWAPRRGPPVSV